jgi:hypothetical protein
MSERFSAVKDSEATLDYILDWSQWLSKGDTISLSNWSVTVDSGDSNPVTIEQQTFSTKQSVVWVSGGNSERHYKLINTITTMQGRTDQRSLFLSIRDR